MYFETMAQLESKSVLDIGMFLKRIGSISRNVKGCEVPEETRLVGIDFWQETDFPVWRNVYNSIDNVETFLTYPVEKKYDLAIWLGMQELGEKADLLTIINKAKTCAKYLLMDKLPLELRSVENVKIINLEEDRYYLLCAEE